MPYYLSSFELFGPQNAHHPVGAEPGFTSIDLRPDGGATLDGGGLNACLLYAPTDPPADPRLVKLADLADEVLPAVLKTKLANKLGATITATSWKDIAGELLLTPPVGKWQPLRPEALGTRYAVWLGGLLWSQNVIEGGLDTYEELQQSGGLVRRPLARDFLPRDVRRDVFAWVRRHPILNLAALLVAAKALGLPPLMVAAVVATDNFNRADSATLGADWTVVGSNTDLGIFSNMVDVTAIGSHADVQTAATWPNDQYAQVVITATRAAGGDNALVRGSTAANTTYGGGHYADNEIVYDSVIWKKVAGTYGTIATNATDIVASDTLYLEVQGTSLLLKVNGTDRVGPSTDTAIASGRAGLFAHHTATNVGLLDTWEGGDFVAGGATYPGYYGAQGYF